MNYETGIYSDCQGALGLLEGDQPKDSPTHQALACRHPGAPLYRHRETGTIEI